MRATNVSSLRMRLSGRGWSPEPQAPRAAGRPAMLSPATKRTTRWRVCATGLAPHSHPRAFTTRTLLAGRLAFGRARDHRVGRVDADAAREGARDLRVRDRRVPVARARRDAR